MYTIYVVTNLVNGKYYIGQTTKTGEERWKDHCWSARKKDYFHFAINKHGKENFEVQDLAVFDSREEVNNAEKLWILLTRSYVKKFGYNSTLGGDYGAIPNDETRAKIGAFSKTRVHTAETRQKMSQSHRGEKNHFFGRKHKPETVDAMKQKLRISHSGEGNYWFGKTLSPEHKLKISLAKRKKKELQEAA